MNIGAPAIIVLLMLKLLIIGIFLISERFISIMSVLVVEQHGQHSLIGMEKSSTLIGNMKIRLI